MSQVYIGTSAFTLQNFYPAGLSNDERLTYYATIFPTCEINSTFYHMPRSTTLENWQKRVPNDFIFAFKVLQDVTHVSGALIDFEVLQKWFAQFKRFEQTPARHLMLFQFAAREAYNEAEFDRLLEMLPKTFLYAFEFRHKTWFVQAVYDRIAAAQASLVLSDSPIKASGQPQWPKVDIPDNAFTYIRFHGTSELYRSSYTEADLKPYVDLIAQKRVAGQDVYAYFNNDAEAHAAANAIFLHKSVFK
jgi:uncharacterized protein YecE (DUF72 family)